MKYLLVAVLTLASLPVFPQVQDEPNGNIKGALTSPNGVPLFDATVYAVPDDLTLDGAMPRSVHTDRNGAFDFTGGLAWGDYKLYIRKDKDGYPNPLDRFYGDLQPDAPKVELREDSPSADVSLTTGEKAGTITGRVVDKDTGAPIKAHISFVTEEGGHSVDSRAKDGEYSALIPPREDVIVMVTTYSRHGEQSQVPLPSMRVEPGQELMMDIPISTK